MKKLEIVKNAIRNRRTESKPDYRDVAAVLLFIFLLPYIVSFFFGNAGIEKKEGGSRRKERRHGGQKKAEEQNYFGKTSEKRNLLYAIQRRPERK